MNQAILIQRVSNGYIVSPFKPGQTQIESGELAVFEETGERFLQHVKKALEVPATEPTKAEMTQEVREVRDMLVDDPFGVRGAHDKALAETQARGEQAP